MTDPEPIDTPEPTEVVPENEPAPDVAPELFAADLAPVTPPKWDTPMEDPEHPLHYHCKTA